MTIPQKAKKQKQKQTVQNIYKVSVFVASSVGEEWVCVFLTFVENAACM